MRSKGGGGGGGGGIMKSEKVEIKKKNMYSEFAELQIHYELRLFE